jgi:hypothetical protein
VDEVLVMMDAKMELQAKRQGKTSAQLWLRCGWWHVGTADFGDPCFPDAIPNRTSQGTPEYIRFVPGQRNA